MSDERRQMWKFPIGCGPCETTIEMPRFACIMAVDSQRDVVCLWAEVNPDEPLTIERRFAIRATGQDFDKDLGGQYQGTCQAADGALVWHVFETTHCDPL